MLLSYYVNRQFVDNVERYTKNCMTFCSTVILQDLSTTIQLVDKSCRIAIEQKVTGLVQFSDYGSQTCVCVLVMNITSYPSSKIKDW